MKRMLLVMNFLHFLNVLNFSPVGTFSNSIYIPYSSTLLHLPPLRSTVSNDAGIEPRTFTTLALAVRRSNPSNRGRHNSFLLFHIQTCEKALVCKKMKQLRFTGHYRVLIKKNHRENTREKKMPEMDDGNANEVSIF